MAEETFMETLGKIPSGDILGHSYFQPSEEPMDWDTSGLVRLDVAIYAAHLMCARIGFRSLPAQIRTVLIDFIRRMAEAAIKVVIGWAFASLAAKIIKQVVLVAEIWKQAMMQREIERHIRRTSLIVRRELLKMKLQPKDNRRIVKRVASRHRA